MKVMKMENRDRKNRQGRPHYTVIFILLIVLTCTVCFGEMIRASNRVSQTAATEMSTLYLREMTSQTIGHFQTSLTAQFRSIADSRRRPFPGGSGRQEALERISY